MFIRSRSPGPVSPCRQREPVAAPVMVAQQVGDLVHPDAGQFLQRGPIHERGGDIASPVPVHGHRRHVPRLDDVQCEQGGRQVRPDPGGVQAGGVELLEIQGHRRHRLLPAPTGLRSAA